MEYVHYPVMHAEVLSFLVPKRENAEMVDATTGEGGIRNCSLKRIRPST